METQTIQIQISKYLLSDQFVITSKAYKCFLLVLSLAKNSKAYTGSRLSMACPLVTHAAVAELSSWAECRCLYSITYSELVVGLQKEVGKKHEIKWGGGAVGVWILTW